MQGPRPHFEIGGAKIFLGVLVLIKKLELLGKNWYLFSKSKNVRGCYSTPSTPANKGVAAIQLLSLTNRILV